MRPKYFLAALTLALSAAQAVEIGPVAGYRKAGTKVTEFERVSFRLECKQPSCAVKGLDAKGQLVLEGRVERIQVVRGDAVAISALQVLAEHAQALAKQGGKFLNPEASPAGPAVFRLPDHQGAAHWAVLDDNFGSYYTLYLVTQQAARASTVSVTDLSNAIKADGWATLYIEFDTNKSELKADGQAAVTEIVKLLRQEPALRLSIDGHTDNVGDAAANRKLALARAQAVQAAVAAQGIEAKRLSAKGFGPDVPIADNRREDGRAKNRRVELTRLP